MRLECIFTEDGHSFTCNSFDEQKDTISRNWLLRSKLQYFRKSFPWTTKRSWKANHTALKMEKDEFDESFYKLSLQIIEYAEYLKSILPKLQANHNRAIDKKEKEYAERRERIRIVMPDLEKQVKQLKLETE